MTNAAQSLMPQAKKTLTVESASMYEMATVSIVPFSVTGLVTKERDPLIVPTEATEPDLLV